MTEIKQLSEEYYKEFLRIGIDAYPGMGMFAPEDYPANVRSFEHAKLW